MAKIPRVTASILGNALIGSPSGNLAVLGSTKAGSPNYTSNISTLQGSAWLAGIAAALIQTPNGLNSPVLQEFAGIMLTLSQQVAYLCAQGAGVEWDSTGATPYYQWAMAQVGGVLYQVYTNAGPVTSNPVTDTNNWRVYTGTGSGGGGGGSGVLLAKVCFDGTGGTGACPIYGAALNVSSVTKVTVGTYLVNFASALPDKNYVWVGGCGAPDGTTAGAQGDNNVACGWVPGLVIGSTVKTQNQLLVLAWQNSPNQLEDVDAFSVMVA